MNFNQIVLLLMLAWVLCSEGMPAPLREFYWAVLRAFSKLFLHVLADVIKLCFSYARTLQDYGQSLCSYGPCPEWEPPSVRYAQQVAYFGAGLLRGIGNFLMDQGTTFMSYSLGTGDTIGAIYRWLSVIRA